MTRQKVKASQVNAIVVKFLQDNDLLNGKTVEIIITTKELRICREGGKISRKKNLEFASGWGLIPLDRKTAKFVAEDISLEYDN